jgi:hypothetical protein
MTLSQKETSACVPERWNWSEEVLLVHDHIVFGQRAKECMLFTIATMNRKGRGFHDFTMFAPDNHRRESLSFPIIPNSPH